MLILKKVFFLAVVFAMIFPLGILANSPANIPGDFCGYSWGTPPEKLPSMDFMYKGDDGYKYSIKNVSDLDASSLIGNIVPKGAFVLFYESSGKKHLFQGTFTVSRKDGETLRDFFTSKFGNPQIYSRRSAVTYIWENNLSVLMLDFHNHEISVKLEKANHVRAYYR